MKVGLVLEGIGDLKAVPCLVARTAELFDVQVIPASLIKSGGALKLRRPGSLEKYVQLAASKPGVEAVVVVVDLDDGCPAEWHAEFAERCTQMAGALGVPVRICFCVREFECWILEDIQQIAAQLPEYGWVDDLNVDMPHTRRDAKGLLNGLMEKHYKETIDQLNLSRKIDIKNLYNNSRSFRKFVKSILGLDYEFIGEYLG